MSVKQVFSIGPYLSFFLGHPNVQLKTNSFTLQMKNETKCAAKLYNENKVIKR